MIEKTRQRLAEYKATVDKLANPLEQSEWKEVREIDLLIINAILAVHQQLGENQRLVLTINMSNEPDEDFESPNKYAELVYFEPLDCSERFQKLIESEQLEVENLGEDFPSRVEISIPANIIPQEDLGLNTSASRGAVLGGDQRIFLEEGSVRYKYLAINQTGLFARSKLHVHPSIIDKIDIVDFNSETNQPPQVIFQIVN